MATVKGTLEVDTTTATAFNIRAADGESGDFRSTVQRSGDRIIISLMNAATECKLTFHSREELLNFVKLLEEAANV